MHGVLHSLTPWAQHAASADEVIAEISANNMSRGSDSVTPRGLRRGLAEGHVATVPGTSLRRGQKLL
jgi:hypothetical protein